MALKKKTTVKATKAKSKTVSKKTVKSHHFILEAQKIKILKQQGNSIFS